MNPLVVVGIPLLLIILGMILNSLDLKFVQPPSSTEQDPARRLTAERQAFREFFDLQRSRALKRQKRTSAYCWLLLFVTAGCFIWLYVATVKTTTLSNRIAMLQTLGTDEGKQTVLSVTQLDGDNVKYLLKPDKTVDTAAAEAAKEKVPSYEVEDLGTALLEGGSSLPSGISVKIANAKAVSN